MTDYALTDSTQAWLMVADGGRSRMAVQGTVADIRAALTGVVAAPESDADTAESTLTEVRVELTYSTGRKGVTVFGRPDLPSTAQLHGGQVSVEIRPDAAHTADDAGEEPEWPDPPRYGWARNLFAAAHDMEPDQISEDDLGGFGEMFGRMVDHGWPAAVPREEGEPRVMCPHCRDMFGPDDLADGDVAEIVCSMCAKAGRSAATVPRAPVEALLAALDENAIPRLSVELRRLVDEAWRHLDTTTNQPEEGTT